MRQKKKSNQKSWNFCRKNSINMGDIDRKTYERNLRRRIYRNRKQIEGLDHKIYG